MPPSRRLSLSHTLLERGLRATASLPALAPQARPAATRAEPVLRSDRASRQMSLPFFAPPLPRAR